MRENDLFLTSPFQRGFYLLGSRRIEMVKRTFTNRHYLDRLQEKIIVFDGGMGTSLQVMDLGIKEFGGEHLVGCNDYLVLSFPQAVERVHRSFLEVGADVIETCTFRSNRLNLGEYGLQDRVEEINFTAASLARHLADEYTLPEQPRFVAGSMGPSGKLPSMSDPDLAISFDELVKLFHQQALGLIKGGVDLLLIETSQDILEVKAAITGIQEAFIETGQFLPIQAQVTLDTTGRMLLGTDMAAVYTILEGMEIDVIGLNCSTGPDYMREPIRFLGEYSTLPISCIPNAGLPLNVDGKAIYPMQPEDFAKVLSEFVENYGINVIGGCCGTTPEHIGLLVEKLNSQLPIQRSILHIPRLASSIEAVPMQQVPAPFLIGERLNTQGSRKFKDLMLGADFESAMTIAQQQVESGAHGLDLCVALTERSDESAMMERLIKVLIPGLRVPLIIDTTEIDVLETALKTTPGRCLINSINLESGQEKMDRIFNLAKKYNAAVIVLTIDENGMAKTALQKLAIARRIYDIGVNGHGLRPGDLVYDALTFTLATGDPEFNLSAVATLEGIQKIKTKLPGVLTSLGVSNVSFGLSSAARAVVNSIMLYHAVQAGLDMAIVNPAQITPYAEVSLEERLLAEDLIFFRRTDALQRLIVYFEKSPSTFTTKSGNQKAVLQKMTPEQRLHWRILHRQKEDIEGDIDEIFDRDPQTPKGEKAIITLNMVLLPAMKEVGDKFGSGELILPFVLQSAEVMKKAVSYLENFLDRSKGISKGTMVLATVYGDVHDIGKNLVKTILSNNGYKVIDLGKQVPAETIISKAVDINADAIGLSALLVSTSKQMPLIINEMQRRGLTCPVLIGGAAINERFGRRILFTDSGKFYDPGVFYCKDAFEGLSVMDALSNSDKRNDLLLKSRRDAELELGRADMPATPSPADSRRSTTQSAVNIPHPSIWGPRLVCEMPLDAVFQNIPKNDLFRLSWGGKNTHGEAWEKLRAEFEERLDTMRRQAIIEKWLQPQGVYGFWPCQSSGEDLLIYDPDSVKAGPLLELERFKFPRQPSGDHLCLADYFAAVESGSMDVVAFQVVTVGEQATLRFDQIQEQNNYSEAYFTHGLAVQTAEASAEYLHRHILRELGFPENRGKRYSWGYPAIPDLSDHKKVFRLLPVERDLGMSLTDAYQLVPEQSTAAIIIHHPQARYYTIGESRINQLMKA
jgi:5-methyltetrahydrofolate--homocysteine methyltransferase